MQKTFLFLLVISLMSFSSDKLVKVKLNSDVTIYIPENFSPMTKEDMGLRYQSYRLPLALYTDPNRLVDFGVNRSYSTWQHEGRPADLEMMGQFYKASILELYDKVIFIDEGLKEVNGHKFVFFEFQSIVYPENDYQDSARKYSYLMYGLSDGTTYLFNFTCDQKSQEEWQKIAQQMMGQIKLKN